jgi:hypothetical protein
MKRRSVHKQTQEPRYKSATWGTRGKTSQNRDTHEKVKTRTLKNQGCGTHNPSGGVKPPLQSAGHNKKPANGTGRPRAKETSLKQPLAGGECSRRGDQAAASTRDERIKNTLSPGGPRMPNEPSGQVAAPTQGTARVRFEFAGRAHRREFTPKLEIKRKENKVKEKEEKFGGKRKKNSPQKGTKRSAEVEGRSLAYCSGWPWWCGTGGISWLAMLLRSLRYAPAEMHRGFGRDDKRARSTGVRRDGVRCVGGRHRKLEKQRQTQEKPREKPHP